jgi:hypothetical protein
MCSSVCMPCQVSDDDSAPTLLAVYHRASKKGLHLQILDGVWGVRQPRRLPRRCAGRLVEPCRAPAAIGKRICIAAHLDGLCADAMP